MIPSFLYHYTSIETALKIIKSKQILFKRLDLLNDPMEGYISRYPYFNKRLFVSCWSKDLEESVAMWKFYGNDFKGVRFKMPIDMFDFKQAIELKRFGNPPEFQLVKKLNKKYSVEISEDFQIGNEIDKMIGPVQINYVKDINQKKLSILNGSKRNGKEEVFNLNLYNLARFKPSNWSFENEYRYYLSIGNIMAHTASRENMEKLNTLEVVTENLLIDLNTKNLWSMEILFGPKCKLEDKEKILSVLEKDTGANCQTRDSKLQINL